MKAKRTTKLIGLLLAVLLCATMLCAMSYSVFANEIPEGGYTVDSDSNTYTVYNEDGLFAWNARVEVALTDNDDATIAPNLVLAADITMTQSWTPVGTFDYPYSGTVDGAGHTITGLNVNGGAFLGFFVNLNGTVKDLSLTDVNVTAAGPAVGAFAGRLGKGGLLVNCHVISGSVSGFYYVGGLVGDLNHGNMVACSNGATVTSTEAFLDAEHSHYTSYAGGIAGVATDAVIIGCYNYGTVIGDGGSVGGIVGDAWTMMTDEDCTSAKVIGSYSTGAVMVNYISHGDHSDIGAIAGTTSSSGGFTEVTATYFVLPVISLPENHHAPTDGLGKLTWGIGNPDLLHAAYVDGTEVTWATAAADMNAAIAEAGYDWFYYANTGADADVRPLLITAECVEHTWANGSCSVCGTVCDHSACTLSHADNGDGTHTATYSICGATVVENHSTTAENDKAADCTEKAYCSVCDSEYGEALGHDFADATCTDPKTCRVCGETEGEALGHDYSDATCTDPKTCKVCGETEGEALGHDYSDATCTDPRTCTICGLTDGDPLGHDFADATCTDPKTCEVCGATEGEELGHDFADATCTDPKTCEVCGATEGEALGHNYAAASCLAPATCTVCGVTDGTVIGHDFKPADCTVPKTCKVCGLTEGEAVGHVHTPATCTTPKTCTVCTATTGLALGHTYDHNCDVDCNVCGEVRDTVPHLDVANDGFCDVCNLRLITEEELSGGAIAGIVIGSVVAVAAVGGIGYAVVAKKKKKEPVTKADVDETPTEE